MVAAENKRLEPWFSLRSRRRESTPASGLFFEMPAGLFDGKHLKLPNGEGGPGLTTGNQGDSMSRFFPEGSDLHRLDLFPGVIAHTAPGEHIHISSVEFQQGGIVERHSHPHEQCGVMVKGRARFEIGDEVRELGPGGLYRIPGGVPHRVVGLEAPALAVDFFFPIRETYLKPPVNEVR